MGRRWKRLAHASHCEVIHMQSFPVHTAAPAPTRQTVLVIEDDLGVLALVRRMLEALGHDVLTAATAAEASAVYAAHGTSIGLIVSDVVLPDGSGPEIVRQLLGDTARARVLYMSGYSSESLLRDGVLQDRLDFIQKPFTRPALAGKVREVLHV